MTNITNLHSLPLASAATVTTIQRALCDGMSPAALLAVADWNERKGYDERRRNSRKRLKNQAVQIRAVAGDLDWSQLR